MVEVEQGGLVSNALSVPITRPLAPLDLIFGKVDINRDVQLLLLVIFAGALGSYFHAMKSLADFIGNQTLTSSWFWWYVTRPFMGMSLALVFYSVLRGGFVMGSPADAKVVNPFGVLAIGALVGMFSDKAAQKLGEVFDVIFKAGDPRTGKLDAPVIARLEPSTVTVGDTKPVVLKDHRRSSRKGVFGSIELRGSQARHSQRKASHITSQAGGCEREGSDQSNGNQFRRWRIDTSDAEYFGSRYNECRTPQCHCWIGLQPYHDWFRRQCTLQVVS